MIKCEKYLNINVSQHTEFIYKHKITNRNIGKYIIQKMKYQSQYHFADIQYCSYKSFSFKYDALLATKYISYKSLYHSILLWQQQSLLYLQISKSTKQKIEFQRITFLFTLQRPPSCWQQKLLFKQLKISNRNSAKFRSWPHF